MKSCIFAPEIIMPNESVDMNAWAVIACDQHTSDRKYWKTLEEQVGEKPSTLRLTLPELYLNDDDCETRLNSISQSIHDYRKNGVFRKLPKGFILVKRKTLSSPLRTGIVLAIDLEEYSFEKSSTSAIRATEATILERIPPRLRIREQAEIEFPHIMLLYSDPNNTVVGSLEESSLPSVYDFDLNMGGGHIEGKFIAEYTAVIERLEQLKKDGLLFMVGDGNHSLATAKTAWEQIKKTLTEAEREVHPARYALCEAVNLYDDGIQFEAIHRIVKGVDPKQFAEEFSVTGSGCGGICIGGIEKSISLPSDVAQAVRVTDELIGNFTEKYGGTVDYIHGEEALLQLTAEHSDYVGIRLPKMDKSQLFEQVLRYGSLPRKTFSMGESEEKRYYIEGKEIR